MIGASITYQELYGAGNVVAIAAMTKLTRNLFLAAAIPLLTWVATAKTVKIEGEVLSTPLPSFANDLSALQIHMSTPVYC